MNELDEAISQAFEELKLKNVALSDEMERYIVDTLVNLRFYSEDSNLKKCAQVTVDNIQKRIDVVLKNIEMIYYEYSNVEVDEKFLYIAKFIAKNIYVLKRYLRSTYDRLPWEEMEFCLVSFIKSCISQDEINLFYKSVLKKPNILHHLQNFALILDEKNKQILANIANIEVHDLGKLPKHETRDNIIKTIVEKHPPFKELYDNYDKIIDIYSLSQMKNYADTALLADCFIKEDQLLITRALQVIGENMKNTLESPKLSNATSKILLQSLQDDTKEIVVKLRDSLSKSDYLCKILSIEDNSDVFSTNIQKNIRKINIVITKILYQNKIETIKTLLKKVINSSCLDQIREVVEIFKFVNFDGMISESKISEHYSELEQLIETLSKKICNKTSAQIEGLKKINEAIKMERKKIKDTENNYHFGIRALSFYSNYIINNLDTYNSFNLDIEVLKIKYKLEEVLMSLKIESDIFKYIEDFLDMIVHDEQSGLTMDSNFTIDVLKKKKIEELYIFFKNMKPEIEMHNIMWLEEFRDILLGNSADSATNCVDNKKISDKEFDEQLTIKLSILKTILNKDSIKSPSKYQNIVEMLVLDIMSILEKKNCLNGNLLYLDDNLPLLTGKNLRNHLAHGNSLLEIFSLNSVSAILSNAAKFTKDNIQNKKIGRIITCDYLKLHDQNLITITNQRNMFLAIKEGNFEKVKFCIRNGADIRGRTHLMTTLHLAAKQSNPKIIKFLFDHNLNVYTKDMNGYSALHIAAIHGSKHFIEFFIQNKDIHIDDCAFNGQTLLHLAAKNGHSEIVKLLFKNKASTTIIDNVGVNPLYYAIFNGHTDTANIFFNNEKNLDINNTDLLYVAIDRGHKKMVNFLLKNNANVNAKNVYDAIPLHAAAIHGYQNFVNVLIIKGSDINCRTINGHTPLHYAAMHNHNEIVKLLIKHGADVNVVDQPNLNTPLAFAVMDGHHVVIETLLKRKANVNSINIKHMSPFLLAASHGHLDILILLLKSSANNITHQNIDGNNALHLSSYAGHIDIVTFLLEKAVNVNLETLVNATNNNKHTSLHLAVLSGHKQVVTYLLLKGANINCIDENGCTALHLCCNAGHDEIVKILVNNKEINLNLRDNLENSPLRVAIKNNFSIIVEILMQAGANKILCERTNFSALHKAALNGLENIVKILLNYIDIDIKTLDNSTPLHAALLGKHNEVAKMLIDRKCDFDAVSDRNETPLSVAVNKNNKECVNILLKKGADVNVGSGIPLQYAIFRGNKEIIKSLLSNEKIKLEVKLNKHSYLDSCAVWGDKSTANILLKKGVKVNPILNDETPETPLHNAAKSGSKDIVKLLLDAGADSNVKNKANRLPIELAIAYGHLSIVEMLLEATSVNINDLQHIAIQEDRVDVVKYLIDKGSNIQSIDNKGLKPIHNAAEFGSKRVLKYLLDNSNGDYGECNPNLLQYAAMRGQKEIVQILINEKFDVNFSNDYRLTPLHYAASYGHKEVVEILLNNGANYESLNIYKKPVEVTSDKDIIKLLTETCRLYKAVKKGKFSEIGSYIKEGAIVNVKNGENVTPLHHASYKGHEKVIETLLRYQANPNVLGKDDCTPLHYAASSGHIGIVTKLLSHGAIYDVKSEKNKIPLDLAKHQDTIALLKLVDESFKSVQNGNPKVIDDLNNIRDIHTMKAIMNARNKENKTVIIAAIQNDFPQIDKLKRVFLYDDVGIYDKAKDLYSQKKYKEALDVYEILFKKRRKILPVDDLCILDIQYDIAWVLYEQSEFTRALELFEEIYDKRKKFLGINNKDTLKVRSAVGLVLPADGKKTEEALNIIKETFLKQSNLLGPDNTDVLITQGFMAFVLTTLGRHDAALKIFSEVYNKYRAIFGIHHFKTLDANTRIAMVLNEQGNHDEALEKYKYIYDVSKREFGASHLYTISILSKMATVPRKQKKFNEALTLYKQVYKFQETTLGSNHRNTVITQFDTANVLFYQGKLVAAFKIYKDTLEQGKLILGPNHHIISHALINMEIIKRLTF